MPRIANIIKEQNRVEAYALPMFKAYDKTTVIKTVWYQWEMS